jgi:SAM-dependent methyltransferase
MAGDAKPNRDQAANWNEASGPIWVEMQGVLDSVMAPFEALLVDEGFPGEGRAVLDVGCGAGATTLAMARRLGPAGCCLGVDISAPLVAAAKARQTAEGIESAAFIEADAQTHAFEPEGFDAVISRFGVMFFEDPQAAFVNIRRAARRGARLTFVAWRSPAENPFMIAAALAAAPLLPSFRPPDPSAPGQFAFADGDRVRRILDASGWQEIDVGKLDTPSSISEPNLLTYATKLGPVGLALRNADAATRKRVSNVLTDVFKPYVSNGAAHFTTACWLVRARA